MAKHMFQTFVILILCIQFTGCAHHKGDELTIESNNTFNSTLWMQSSAEFEANVLQTYNTATKNLDELINNKSESAAIEQKEPYSSLPPAVIMDVDETVLNNSSYNAQLMLDGAKYSPTLWDQWVSLSSATALPGAVKFINHAKQNGVEVLFITNRTCKERTKGREKCPQKIETLENLTKVGVSGVQPSSLLLQMEQNDWTSEKESRRKLVAEKYRIVMLFGDDLGDFLPNVKKNITPSERARLVADNEDKWGRIWYMFPNPKYGSWLHILKAPKSQYLKGY